MDMSDDFKYFVAHLRFEALALAALMVALTEQTSAPLWILIVAFPVFDICMLAYMVSQKLGAQAYNLTHNATIPTLCVAAGVVTDIEYIAVVGFTWTFHIAVDRVFGYGLKHRHSFVHTHLGPLKRSRK